MEAMTGAQNISQHDRVRANTSPDSNRRIEDEMRQRVLRYAGKSRDEISARIAELDEEWDIERWLECNASALAFGGIALSLLRGKKWLLLPAFVLPMLFYHAVQGWCPPVPLLRRFGVRTQQEIDAEKYALRLLRGDFEQDENPAERALRVFDPELRPVE
jgi:hypothetical protein